MYVCARCGSEFVPKDQSPKHLERHPPRYCSRACGRSARRSRVTLVCRQCRQPFGRKAYMAEWSQERGPFCGFPCYAAWQSEHTQGSANPNYHRTFSECDYCHDSFEHRPSEPRRFCSRRCFHAFAKSEWARTTPNSRGAWRHARRKALERDRWTCQDCGAREHLVVHHIRPFAECENRRIAHALDNLVTVCAACHQVRHGRPAGSPH